jgi:ABC-2 type transport system ATP-binding protein
MKAPAIAVSRVQKAFGPKVVLRAVTLAVAPGELLGLVGPNGAGKSTLLRTLLGLVPRDGGDVAVLGLDPRTASLAIRQRTCYLPGETGVYQQMTGAQFLRFALGFYPAHDVDLRERLLTGFALPLQQKVRSYSAGMKQKLALAGALLHQPALLMLDEPLTGLDAHAARLVKDLLRQHVQSGGSVLLTTHILEVAERLADRIGIITRGELISEGTLAELRSRAGSAEATLEDLFLRLTVG